MAMHCPRCLTEYREGFSECADCHVALAPGAPPVPEESGPEGKLVSVLESSDAFAVSLAKGNLEEAGIEYAMGGDDADERGISGLTPAGAGKASILVEPDDVAAALEVLDPILNPVAIEEGDATAETEA